MIIEIPIPTLWQSIAIGLYFIVGFLCVIISLFMDESEAAFGRAFGYPCPGASVIKSILIFLFWPMVIVLLIIIMIYVFMIEIPYENWQNKRKEKKENK